MVCVCISDEFDAEGPGERYAGRGEFWSPGHRNCRDEGDSFGEETGFGVLGVDFAGYAVYGAGGAEVEVWG